uniref:Putative coat protein n=1 Tax=viral metagenome TaxID=1070528 RepID=A0A6H1ZKP9_9ZZZZ
MANSLTGGNQEVWSRDMQAYRKKTLMALDLCNYEFAPLLKRGDTFHKPYGGKFHVVSYTKGTDISNRQDASITDESGSIDQVECVPIYLDEVDDIQNSYAPRKKMAERMQYTLNKRLDAVVLAEYDNAGQDVDDGDFGGTAGTAHSFSTSDIDKMFSVAGKKLNLQNVDQAGRFMVIGPSQLQLLQDLLSSKNTVFGDKVGATGAVGARFGFDVYVSNNLTFTARWTPANNPTDADTITIAGVTITFKTTPALGGAVDIGGSTAVTLDNLVALLNNSSAYAAEAGLVTAYFEFTQANRVILDSIVATDGTTYLDIECIGMGEVVVAGSDATDTWTLHTLHCVAGCKGATSMVLQKAPGLKVVADPDRLGDNLTAWQLYGVKTFTAEDKYNLVDINVDASGFKSSSAA